MGEHLIEDHRRVLLDLDTRVRGVCQIRAESNRASLCEDTAAEGVGYRHVRPGQREGCPNLAVRAREQRGAIFRILSERHRTLCGVLRL